jgi:hypothetical protein
MVSQPAHRLSCSALARALGEPLYGTAPVSKAWMLLEQPGPWGAKALHESDLDPETADELDRRSKDLGFRVLLVRRRPGRYETPDRACFLARSDRSGVWMERITFATPSQLLEDLDLRALSQPMAPGLGTAVSDPVYLICTNGRRDPCCAERGRRLGAALTGLGKRLWESSHFGGHRFAANMACFPEAIFYGRVGPDKAGIVVKAHEQRELSLSHYRGRSCDQQLVQAADFLVRQQTGLMGLDDLSPAACSGFSGEGEVELSFRHQDGQYIARLEVRLQDARATSCRSDELERPKEYRLLNLRST